MTRSAALIIAILSLGSCSATARTPHSLLSSRVPDIGFEPTSYPVAKAMLELAGGNASDVVFDLGSGDGRIVNMEERLSGGSRGAIRLHPSYGRKSLTTDKSRQTFVTRWDTDRFH